VTALPDVPVLERPDVDWVRHKGDGRPKILPPPGETWRNPATNRKIGHRYYTRVTTYADAITESYNLTAWKLRRLLKGAANRRDYVLRAASLSLEDRDRDEFDQLVELVLEAAGESASLLGTTLHSLTEALDRGEDLGTPPDEVLPDLAAYTALTQGLIAYVHREARVVCDQLETAGTPDGHAHIAEPCPAGCGPEVVHIIDTKTGSIRYPGKMSTQLAIYSRSDLYDPATGERTPIEVCQRWGAILHLPVETGEAAPFWLDLDHGWRGAELCGPVRTWHKAKADEILRPFESVQPVRVVDGEVTRFEARLASWNPKSPTERPADPSDITDALKVSSERVEPDVAEVPALEAAVERDAEGDEAALHEDLVEPEREPLPDRCAHTSTKSLDGRRVCADCGEPREPVVEPTRCGAMSSTTDPAATRCELAAGHRGAHDYEARPTPAERCVHELRLGECAMPACRPDLAHLDDEGVERETGPTEIKPFTLEPAEVVIVGTEHAGVEPEVVRQLDEVLAEEVDAEAERVGWPGVDDVPIEQLASGPDSDAEDEPGDGAPPGEVAGEVTDPHVVADPVREAIVRCVTTRDLELLSTTAWRSWGPEHRALAAEVHDRLELAERAARPVAAFEAAVKTASDRRELLEIMNTAAGAEWMTPALEQLAGDRWAELRVLA